MEKKDKTSFTLHMSKELHKQMKKHAADKMQSMQSLLTQMIEQYLKENK